MIIGILKENQKIENRVPLTPKTASQLKTQGFEIIVESKSGEKSLFSDDDYKNAGAIITQNSKEVLNNSDVLFKQSFFRGTAITTLSTPSVSIDFKYVLTAILNNYRRMICW